MNNRDIDALIAEKVMGLEIVRPANDLQPQDVRIRPIGATAQWIYCAKLPRYTEDIAAAMTVVEHIGDCLHLREHSETGNWSAEFCGAIEGESNADTASLAICLAALKFFGVEITKDVP